MSNRKIKAVENMVQKMLDKWENDNPDVDLSKPSTSNFNYKDIISKYTASNESSPKRSSK